MSELNKIVTNFPMSLSQDENRNLALTLSAVLEGGGGGVANAIWKPAVDQDGDLTWSWDTFPDSARPPETVNIKGPRGESGAPGRDGTNGTNGTNGKDGTDGKDGLDGKTPQIQINSTNAHWEWRYSGASEWTDLGVVASGAVGPQGIPGVSGASGAPGANGEPGEDGFSPAVTMSAITDSQHPNGGTRVTITDKDHPTGQNFDIFNGNDGSGSSDEFDPFTMSGYGTEAAPYGVDTTVIATQAWVAEQGYLTAVPDSYATKTYANEASANALSQAESWVETQGYLKSVSVASGSLAGSGTTNEPLALKTSAEQALSSVANKLEPPPHNTQQSTNYIWSDPLGQGIPGWIDANNWLNEALENTDFLHAEDLRWYISPENGVSGKWDNEELKLGIDTTNMTANKQYAFTTTGWEEVVVPSTSGYLPTSGGTVSGQLEVHGGSNFDQQFLKLTREGVTGHARLGLGQYGALALKTDDSNSHTTQVNISPNASNDQLVQVQHNGNQVGYLIPAQIHQGSYTPTSADGILHIVLES